MLRWLKPLAAFVFALLLCACVKGEWTDLVSFCEKAGAADGFTLRLTECLVSREEGELRCFWRVDEGLHLRLICTEQGSVMQCRVILQRMAADGNAMPVSEERKEAFCRLVHQVCAGLQEVSPRDADAMFEALRLRDRAAYEPFGKSDLLQYAAFSARLVNLNAETVLELSNRRLFPQEEKQTPESVPAFDETTNIRTETVPLS